MREMKKKLKDPNEQDIEMEEVNEEVEKVIVKQGKKSSEPSIENSATKEKKIKNKWICCCVVIVLVALAVVVYVFSDEKPGIKRFKEIVPSFLKLDSKGDLYINYKSGFNEIPLKKILYRQEFRTIPGKLLSGLESIKELATVKKPIFHSLSYFNFVGEEIINLAYESKKIIARIILGQISIKKEDITLEQSLLDNLKGIAKSPSSNEDKAKDLIKIFDSIGYFIPLQIQIGGMLKINIEEGEESKYKKLISEVESKKGKSIKGSSDYTNFKDLFYNKDVIIIGGDRFKQTFEEWIETLKLENAEIIGYKDIIDVTLLLDINLKSKLKEPLKIVDEKYNKRRKYYEYLSEAKKKIKKDKWHIKENDEIIHGTCHTDDDLIILVSQQFDEDWGLFGKQKNKVLTTDEGIIVGWKFKSNKPIDGELILDDPLLKKEVAITFNLNRLRASQSFKFELYSLKLPE